jgi:hypothetical protein
MSSPRNTTTNAPILNYIGGLDALYRTGNSSNIILEMEAQGQRQLVESEVLPTEIQGDRDGAIKQALIELGFKFGEVVKGDPLFTHVELPVGWKKVGSDHNMWSYVNDEQGRQRISVFYKAAPYDRRARMEVNTGNFA